MKPAYVLGNWKSNLTIDDASVWIDAFSAHRQDLPKDITVIVCPAFHHLSILLQKKLSISVGVQDLSQYPSGAYTGEISATMLGNGISYALLGHSERRTHFGETDETIAQKAQRAMETGIKPIICVSHESEVTYIAEHLPGFAKVGMLLYEPLSAIGSGQPDSPVNANGAVKNFKAILNVPILYGGSVKPDNVKGFMSQEFLDGVGVGGASLNPETFFSLIRNASV
jgi:triosephosphate isomerase